MNKEKFIKRRTAIISKMIENQGKNGIFPTTICFAELDDLYDEINNNDVEKRSTAQLERDKNNYYKNGDSSDI